MRIIGGTARGRPLRTAAGLALRPTGERAREALFDIISARVPGSRFLDLFAGSGAVGIEALSRGAASVTFVDNHPSAWRCVRENLARTGFGPCRLLKMDFRSAVEALSRKREVFDVVYIDPPYESGNAALALRHMQFYPILAPGGLAVVETSRLLPLAGAPRSFQITGRRRYGDTELVFVEQDSAAPAGAAESGPGGTDE